MRKLAYVLAASHSGSTLLTMLLGAHPETCTVGELKLNHLGNLEKYRCGCGEPINSCPLWNEVIKKMKHRGIDFSLEEPGTDILKTENALLQRVLKPLHRGPLLEFLRDSALLCIPAWHHHFKEVQKRNRALIDSLLELHDAKIVIDSSKIGRRLKFLLRDRETDIRVVRLIRDGRGVALTHIDPLNFADAKDPSKRVGGFGGNRKPITMHDAAYIWKRSNEEAESIISTIETDKYIEVRYDELCSDPTATLKKIFLFIGVDPEKLVLDFRSVTQHVVGNGMRLDDSSEITYDERWRDHLTQEQLREFDSVAGSLNRKYGYV